MRVGPRINKGGMYQVSEEMQYYPAVSPVLLSTWRLTFPQQSYSNQLSHLKHLRKEAICILQIKMEVTASACAAVLLPLLLPIHTTHAVAETAALKVSISPLLTLRSKGLKEEEVVPVSATRSKRQWDLGGHVAQVGLICGTKTLPDPLWKASKVNGRFVFLLFCSGASMSW